jgi:hypothetical protein
MSEELGKLMLAGARLIDAAAAALESYTKLQEKKAEYFANAASQTPQDPDKPFEEFKPGYFESRFKGSIGDR